MRQAHVPGRVAADRMAGEKHAVGIDRKPPAGIAQAGQHGGVFAGREAVFALAFLEPVDGDHDVAEPRGLAQAVARSRRERRPTSRSGCSGVVPAPLSVTIVG